MARLEFTTPSGKRSYEIVDEFVTIGREVGNHLRLSDPAVAPVHLRLFHGQDGYRLEVADAELKVEVNGESCVTRSLKPSDRIHIGGTTLTFVDERAAPQPPVEALAELEVLPEPEPVPVRKSHATTPHQARRAPPPAPRHQAAPHPALHHPAPHHPAPHHPAPHHPAPHHHHHHHVEKKRPAWFAWVVGASAFVLVAVLMRLLGVGSYYREESSPDHWLTVAESQLEAGDLDRALDSCRVADLSGPDGPTKERIQSLRDRIKQRMQREEDQGTLDQAQRSFETMRQFEAKYLASAHPVPAVRDLARNAKYWLEHYGEVVRRHTDKAPLVPQVQGLFDRYAPLAQLDRPDDAADVQFAIEQRLALPRPLYRDALNVVDGYLSAHPSDPSYADLTERRDAVVNAARADFDRHGTEARRLLAERRFAEARKEVLAMREAIVMNSWAPLADAVDRDINRAEK